MNTALVTGGYGLLGSWLVKRLLELGRDVVVLDRECASKSALNRMGLTEQVATVCGDVCDGELVATVITDHEVDTIFHLAAQTIVGTARTKPLETFEANVRGTWQLLEAARSASVQCVVVASSDKAYGSQELLPYREDAPLLAREPYEVSKAAADMVARSFAHTYGLPVAVTRCANLYGGGDLNDSRLVPEAITAVLGSRPPVVRSDGSPERDFLYVEDAVTAYLDLEGALRKGRGIGDAFNIGTGEPRSVAEVVGLICELCGSEVEPDIRGSGTPMGEIDRQYVDATKFQQLTGWQPQCSLEEGLSKAIEWHQEYGHD